MNFTEALGYSFKGHNIPKILTIVLVFIIIGVSIFVSSIMLESVALIFALLPVFLGFSVFVAGYTISVIGSVMNGDDYLPAIKIGRDLGRGAVVIIASIIYSIPFFILFGVIFALLGFCDNFRLRQCKCRTKYICIADVLWRNVSLCRYRLRVCL